MEKEYSALKYSQRGVIIYFTVTILMNLICFVFGAWGGIMIFIPMYGFGVFMIQKYNEKKKLLADMKANGVMRKAMIVNYQDSLSISTENNTSVPNLTIVVAYLDNNNEVKVGTVDTYQTKEVPFRMGCLVDVIEYNGNLVLNCSKAVEEVPEELKAAVDAYYEIHQTWAVLETK
jgi:hypothetical protein